MESIHELQKEPRNNNCYEFDPYFKALQTRRKE